MLVWSSCCCPVEESEEPPPPHLHCPPQHLPAVVSVELWLSCNLHLEEGEEGEAEKEEGKEEEEEDEG